MDQSPPGISGISGISGVPTHSEPELGFFPRLGAALFGARAKRLREQASRSHLLSYLLIIAQSITTVLVFGLSEVQQALTGALVARIIAGGALALLTITVFASDIALLETLKRIPPLARNRQHAQNTEHILYVLFVLLVEGVTYGIVLYTLDSNPRLFTSGQSLVPDAGPWFIALVVLRVTLICWSAVQLFIVRSKLPVLLSTLMNTGKEIVGGHVEEQLKALDVRHIPVRATFGVYSRMSEAPRPVPGILNALTGGWIVKRALAREAEEARQAQNISAALAEIDTFTSHTANMADAAPVTPAATAPSAIPTASLRQPLAPTRMSPRDRRRANLEADMRGLDADEYDLSALDVDADEEDERDWASSASAPADDFGAWDDDATSAASYRRHQHVTHPRMSSQHTQSAARRDRAQAAHMAPRGAELVVREFAMPDLPASKYEYEGDSSQARAVFRVLEQDPRASRREVIARTGVSDGTARRYMATWSERRGKRGKKKIAPRTTEMAAITPEMLASTSH